RSELRGRRAYPPRRECSVRAGSSRAWSSPEAMALTPRERLDSESVATARAHRSFQLVSPWAPSSPPAALRPQPDAPDPVPRLRWASPREAPRQAGRTPVEIRLSRHSNSMSSSLDLTEFAGPEPLRRTRRQLRRKRPEFLLS